VDFDVEYTEYGKNSGWHINFEGAPHASVHNYIGGHMGSMVSTNDPLFYLHHSNIDRLWWI